MGVVSGPITNLGLLKENKSKECSEYEPWILRFIHLLSIPDRHFEISMYYLPFKVDTIKNNLKHYLLRCKLRLEKRLPAI